MVEKWYIRVESFHEQEVWKWYNIPIGQDVIGIQHGGSSRRRRTLIRPLNGSLVLLNHTVSSALQNFVT